MLESAEQRARKGVDDSKYKVPRLPSATVRCQLGSWRAEGNAVNSLPFLPRGTVIIRMNSDRHNQRTVLAKRFPDAEILFSKLGRRTAYSQGRKRRVSCKSEDIKTELKFGGEGEGKREIEGEYDVQRLSVLKKTKSINWQLSRTTLQHRPSSRMTEGGCANLLPSLPRGTVIVRKQPDVENNCEEH